MLGTMVEICQELGHQHASSRLDFVGKSACIPSTGGQLRISMREAEFKNPAKAPKKLLHHLFLLLSSAS